MHIALLGAGHIGQTIARLLAAAGQGQDYQVTVMDKNPAALARLAGPGIGTQVVDTEDAGALAAALRHGHQAVVNALPYHLAVPTATAARAAGCHYFDLTEDVAATRAIQQLAEGADTAFMPQCGLAPGFIGIVAHHLAQGFEALHDVKMRAALARSIPSIARAIASNRRATSPSSVQDAIARNFFADASVRVIFNPWAINPASLLKTGRQHSRRLGIPHRVTSRGGWYEPNFRNSPRQRFLQRQLEIGGERWPLAVEV